MSGPSLVERIESLWWYWYAAKEGQEWDRFQSILSDVRELQAAATFARNAIGVCDSRCRQCLRCETDERLTIALTKTGAI